MRTIIFNPRDFGLKKDYLYEIIATTFSKSKNENALIPNAACMGIKLIESNSIKIGPYPNTNTFRNLKQNGFISINFVNNVYLYAIAALKGKEALIDLTEFPNKFYDYKSVEISGEFNSDSREVLMPYVNKAWGVLFCKAVEENQVTKKDGLGEVQIIEFKLKVISFEKFKESFKLFNRAENLSLETVVLATRLKIAKERKNKKLFDSILQKIQDNMQDIERFGGNKNAIKSLELIKKFISRSMY